MAVVWSSRALREAKEATVWWHANRPYAPDLFDEELARAVARALAAPASGAPLDSGKRRMLLTRTRYMMVYKVVAGDVEVLSVWSTLRGKPPRLGGER